MNVLKMAPRTIRNLNIHWHHRAPSCQPLSKKIGTHKTATARFWPWLSGRRTSTLPSCSLFARQRTWRRESLKTDEFIPHEGGSPVGRIEPEIAQYPKSTQMTSVLARGGPVPIRSSHEAVTRDWCQVGPPHEETGLDIRRDGCGYQALRPSAAALNTDEFSPMS